MDFHKIPSSATAAIVVWEPIRLGRTDGRTDRQTDRQRDGRRANFLERYVLITIPSGFDKRN